MPCQQTQDGKHRIEVNTLTNEVCQWESWNGRAGAVDRRLVRLLESARQREDRLICRVDVDNTYALPCRFHYVDRQLRLLREGYDD